MIKLTILGGGGFRVPLVYGALLRDRHDRRIDAIALHDVDETRLTAIRHVLDQMALGYDDPPRVLTTTSLDDALAEADFVFSAIRVGGLEARTGDEHVALDLGVLGQETTGPGGLAYGLRTVPVALKVAERVTSICPRAWVINFTNPAGLVTEAMQAILGDRVIGICDSPIGLARRAALALGVDPGETTPDYVGLNHLGWLRGLDHDGSDILPGLFRDISALHSVEEARLFGLDWVRTLAALPNEYLYYYYFEREALASMRAQPLTRGDFLLRQQADFYRAVSEHPDRALAEWQRVRRERDTTYMADERAGAEAGDRSAADVSGGGYEAIAMAFVAATLRDERETMILNVRNGSTLAGLPADAVVEVPCQVDEQGARPMSTGPVAGYQLGLMQQVKAVEQLTIEAARSGDPAIALKAFALHPLVDSVSTARALLSAYRHRIPGIADVLR